jgi:hypothetical protein
VLPATVHTAVLFDLKLTGRPDVLVAETVNGADPITLGVMTGKAIVCATLVTVKDRITWVAAAHVEASPAWLAATAQLPALTTVTVFPLTVQIVGDVELNVTARPELAVALTVNGAAVAGTAGNALKVMVCGFFAIVKLRVTCVAGVHVVASPA